jgi:hypothetical protein
MTNDGETKETRCSERITKSSTLGRTRKDTSEKISKDLARTNRGYERHHVKHDYHDYARVVTVSSPLHIEMEAKFSGGVNNPFPTILHKLLSETDMMGFANIISWQPHGRSFLIHKPKEFVKDVVPRYFKHSKLSSFQRQLSLYGFVRLTNESPAKGAYYHEVSRRTPYYETESAGTFVKHERLTCSLVLKTCPSALLTRTIFPVFQNSTNASEGDLGQDIVVARVGARLSLDGSCARPAGNHRSGTDNQLRVPGVVASSCKRRARFMVPAAVLVNRAFRS